MEEIKKKDDEESCLTIPYIVQVVLYYNTYILFMDSQDSLCLLLVMGTLKIQRRFYFSTPPGGKTKNLKATGFIFYKFSKVF